MLDHRRAIVAHENNGSAGDAMTAMIHIHGPQDGNFIAQFLTKDGRSLAILVPEGNAAVLRELQESMPYGLAVRDIDLPEFDDDEDAAMRRRPMKGTPSGA
jgi:hypothetical protein